MSIDLVEAARADVEPTHPHDDDGGHVFGPNDYPADPFD